MRLIWVSDSPTTPSGFGAVTREVCGRLAALGHDVEILGWQNRWTTTDWNGIPVRPVRWNDFGADVLLSYAMRFRPDFIVTLGDPWWLSFMADPPLQRYLDTSGARWALYYPVDGATPDGTLPPSWAQVLEAADVPIAMSRYGVRVSRASGVRAEYIPHGCDLDAFAPPENKSSAKERLGYRGAFVILSDARNQPRKMLPRLLDIVAAFASGKDDVVLHVHADPDDDAATSDLYYYRLRADVRAAGLSGVARFSRDFRMTSDGGLPVGKLAEIYQAADVHLLTSWGEGFGLPNLQAAAAGVVPMAVAYAASEELVSGHGVALPIESSVTDEFGLRRCLLAREPAVEALETLYRDREQLAVRAAQGRAFALAYGWDRITDRWEEVLRTTAPRQSSPVATLHWGTRAPAADRGPPPSVAAATADVFSALPGGVSVTVRMSERRQGAVAAQILSDAFVVGDELSIPVRLPPLFEDAPRAAVGALYVAPGSEPLARRAAAIFPGLARIRRPEDDPPERVGDELLPRLARCCLAVDVRGTGPRDLAVACAALGVPYLGAGDPWPPVPIPDNLLALRLLLTDQGYSEARRRQAYDSLLACIGEHVVRAYRDRARTAVRAEPAGMGAA